jgi:superfamily I DNA/RNA helicase/mRNA-degrading endonuclease RelE of RelBE toxin-antitoxin system
MEFRIADTFSVSLARLTADEQKAVKTTAFDLQVNPANPGLSFHKLDRARDKDFWSVRVSRDIRIIVHRSEASLLLCYVNHHDDAYKWAERRKLETHPKTGAAQIVEIRETIREIEIPKYVEAEQMPAPKPALFSSHDDDDLLSYGVPAEWLEDVKAANEDSLLAITDHLPSEAAEALLELATGGKPDVTAPAPQKADPFEHPDAQRRFRIMSSVEELERALEYPWDKWTIFLHPEQRKIVTKDYNGPSRVSGSAGTGKTIVALHRAVHLVRIDPDSRVLLTTFSDILANSLRTKVKRLIINEPRLGERLDVAALDELGLRLYRSHIGGFKFADIGFVRNVIKEVYDSQVDKLFSLTFVNAEWDQIVDAWQIRSWDDYRDVKRLGRKTRLSEQKREWLWSIYAKVIEKLDSQGMVTNSGMYSKLANKFAKDKNSIFDHIVVDEAQDVNPAQLRLFGVLVGDKPNGIMFTGDLGQRIFQQPFSWKSLGIDLRGRSKTLRVNYRTSHQIRSQADMLLSTEVADVDGNVEVRKGTVSVFNGPSPKVEKLESPEAETKYVAEWIKNLLLEGIQPHEIGIFVRSKDFLQRAIAVAEAASVPYKAIDNKMESISGKVAVSTMHLAKGLEFRAVAVMACDDEIIPLQERVESIADDSDLEEVYNTERHLLYVACTRARDNLLVTSGGDSSEFLDDFVF